MDDRSKMPIAVMKGGRSQIFAEANRLWPIQGSIPRAVRDPPAFGEMTAI
jgi:hypothetical protein